MINDYAAEYETHNISDKVHLLACSREQFSHVAEGYPSSAICMRLEDEAGF